jgi:hypothetical protein
MNALRRTANLFGQRFLCEITSVARLPQPGSKRELVMHGVWACQDGELFSL